ncbi:MAG TPA: alpha/beta hydrolase [Pseudolysinimonas sp.]|nr:alpha/beta hydrolase [Pseudolysinimonas sp.]
MTGTHAIVLPGGGYRVHGRDGAPAAAWLRGLGLPAQVFEYPLFTRHPGPLTAVRAEIARVRRAGAERVVLVGFSAGGHAAALAALAPDAAQLERADAVVLGYPVVSFQLARAGVTRDTLIGDDAPAELRAQTSVDLLVTPDAPPFFIWHTAEDEVIPVEHSYRLGDSLRAAGVSHELHIFPHGAHGIGQATGVTGVQAWPELCRTWFAGQGLLGDGPPVQIS